jgi:hypothetical protein
VPRNRLPDVSIRERVDDARTDDDEERSTAA